MKSKTLIFIIAIFLFDEAKVQSQVLAGRELHVAKTGRNSANGSEKHPFFTINEAANNAKPGDKIVIHGGTYREQVILTHGGFSKDSAITFISKAGETVIVKGSTQVTSWKLQYSGVWRADVPDTLFGNFNPFTTLIKGQTIFHLGEIYVNGVPYAEQSTQDAVSNTTVSWFASRNAGFTSIWVNFGNNNPTKNFVEINTRPAAFVSAKGINYITIDHIKIAQVASDRASVDAEQPGAISTGGGTHWIIQNCEITDAKCVAISLAQPGGHDLSRSSYNRPAFGEFEDTSVVGHHIVRNNYIRRCGQAGIFGLLHGTLSEITGNQIEDIKGIIGFPDNDVSGIHLAVAVDAIIRGNLIRRITNGAGIMLGPIYQGIRITTNVITDVKGSPLYLYRSHGPALIDNNVFVGPGVAAGEGIKLRSAEANVFARNLFADCTFTNKPLPAREASGTISYRPHSLVTKQTIPALPLDNKWFNNIFIRGGLDTLPQNHGEADHNIYMGLARKSIWGDAHSSVVAEDGGFRLISTASAVNIIFDLARRPNTSTPVIDADFVGRFALSQSIEWPDGRPVKLVNDFFGNTVTHSQGIAGPFVIYPGQNTKTARLFAGRERKEVRK